MHGKLKMAPAPLQLTSSRLKLNLRRTKRGLRTKIESFTPTGRRKLVIRANARTTKEAIVTVVDRIDPVFAVPTLAITVLQVHRTHLLSVRNRKHASAVDTVMHPISGANQTAPMPQKKNFYTFGKAGPPRMLAQ